MCQHNLDQVPHFKWVDSWTQVPGFLRILKQLESFKSNTYLTLSRLLHNFRIYMNDANRDNNKYSINNDDIDVDWCSLYAT